MISSLDSSLCLEGHSKGLTTPFSADTFQVGWPFHVPGTGLLPHRASSSGYQAGTVSFKASVYVSLFSPSGPGQLPTGDGQRILKHQITPQLKKASKLLQVWVSHTSGRDTLGLGVTGAQSTGQHSALDVWVGNSCIFKQAWLIKEYSAKFLLKKKKTFLSP